MRWNASSPNGRRNGPHRSPETGCRDRLPRRDGTRMMTARHNSISQNASLRADLLLALALIGLCVAARMLPHVSNFSPVAAAALFAGAMLGRRSLALLVPIAAMLISDLV